MVLLSSLPCNSVAVSSCWSISVFLLSTFSWSCMFSLLSSKWVEARYSSIFVPQEEPKDLSCISCGIWCDFYSKLVIIYPHNNMRTRFLGHFHKIYTIFGKVPSRIKPFHLLWIFAKLLLSTSSYWSFSVLRFCSPHHSQRPEMIVVTTGRLHVPYLWNMRSVFVFEHLVLRHLTKTNEQQNILLKFIT